METLKRFPLLLLFAISVLSCSDFLETDISNERVNLLAPYDGLATTDADVSFWWDSLQWADVYELQVVTPSFDSVEYLVVDIEQTGLIYDANLAEGDYQWRVIAKNSAYEAFSDTFNLSIVADTTGSLDGLTLGLLSPEDGLITNETSISFLWSALDAADNYRWQLASPDFSNSSYILFDEYVTDDFHIETLPEGDYMWRVRAENATGSISSETRSLTVDVTAPENPTLLSPNSVDTVYLPVNLTWASAADGVGDTLYIHSDSLVSDPILKVPVSTMSYDLDAVLEDTSYFWRVRSVDAAGNVSGYSLLGKFWVGE